MDDSVLHNFRELLDLLAAASEGTDPEVHATRIRQFLVPFVARHNTATQVAMIHIVSAQFTWLPVAVFRRAVEARLRETAHALKAITEGMLETEETDLVIVEPEIPDVPYMIKEHCIYRVIRTPRRVKLVRLANFEARIVEDIVVPGGRVFALEGVLYDGTQLPRIEIKAGKWAGLQWAQVWAPGTWMLPGGLNRDHLRAAIQFFSGTLVPVNTRDHV